MGSFLVTDRFFRTFYRRDFIPTEPNKLWLIKQGVVRTLSWNEQGTYMTLGYWGAQEVLGVPLSNVDPYQIQCLTAVEAWCVPESQWHQLLPAIYQHIQQTKEFFCIVRSERISQRLQQFLVWLSRKFGTETEQGYLIKLRLTHQEIGESIGTTRVTVSRLLGQLEQESMILRSGKDLIVLHHQLWNTKQKFEQPIVTQKRSTSIFCLP